MAHKVAAATGLWSAAATWNSVTNTPTLHASTNITISTSNLFTATFTAPNTTNACTGVLIFINAVGSGGTVTVTLQESTVDTAAAVSIAVTSLVAGTWVYFRFATPYVFTTTGAGAYRFKIVNALAAGTTSAAADSGAANIAYLATDDRTGVPGATDDIWIVGHNQVTAITVTMDGTQTCGSGTDASLISTVSTHTLRSIGWAIQLCNSGKLIWDTAADARLTCRGTIAIGANSGELDIGTVATPMPAARVGRLTMDVITTNGLYGIFVKDGGRFIGQGAAKSSTTLWKAKYVSGTGTAASPLVVDAAVDWSVGDEIFVGATSNNATNYNETESRFIITKNSATSYVISTTAGGAEAALTFTHTTDAWVLNMQRNVLIDALLTTRGYQFYNDSVTAGNVDFDWVRFETLAGTSTQHFSALAAATGRVAMDHCVWYRSVSNRFAATISLSTIAHTFTGLIATGCAGSANSQGAFHILSCSNKTFTDCFFIKNNSQGMSVEASFGITLTTCAMISNNTGATATNGCGFIITSSGPTLNSCEIHANRAVGIMLNTAINPRFTTCNIGNKGTNVIDVSSVTSTFNDALFISCVFGSATLISNYLTMLAGSEIKFHRLNNTTNNHRWYTPGGSFQASGAGLTDTNVRTAGTLNVKGLPENATEGIVRDFLVLAKASSVVSATGFIQKNAAFATDPVTVELFLPGSIVADYTQTMPNDTVYNPFSVFANYSGTVPAYATVRITGKSVTAAAYFYIADFFNGTNDITNLKTWNEGQPSAIMFEQLGDAQAFWSVLKSVQTTAGQMGYEITTDLDDIQTRLQTVDDLVDDLETRLTATRAGYLDNLSAGAVALQASVDDLEGRLTAGRAANLDNLDATISSRASQTSLNTLDDYVDTEIADILARLPAALVGGRMDSNVQAMATDVITAAVLAASAITEIQSGLAVPGSAMTLTSGERDAIAAAFLDLADAIETGLTPRQAMRLFASALAGVLSGAATNTVTIRNAVANSKARITATVDSDGNRSAVSTDTT